MNEADRPNSEDFQPKNRHWHEEINLAGTQLVDEVKRIVHQGNIRTLRIKHDGKVLVEIPVTAAAGVGAVTVLLAPQIAVLGAIAGLIARCTVEVEHETVPAAPAAEPDAAPETTASQRLV